MTDRDAVRSAMVDALCEVYGRDEVEAALADQPDDYLRELDSKTAEYLLVAAEVVVGRQLPTPAELGRDQFASLGLLIDVALKDHP
jgi:hypothetical protein